MGVMAAVPLLSGVLLIDCFLFFFCTGPGKGACNRFGPITGGGAREGI